MSESVHTNPSLYSKGMLAVICAQFLSAFGDNALLFATLALMKQLYYPEWSQPVLQMLFVGAYILFAPFVGQFADSFAKGRVMMVANGLKLLGAGCICFGVRSAAAARGVRRVLYRTAERAAAGAWETFGRGR